MSAVVQSRKKIHMLGLPNVTNTIQKVQGSPMVFTTIEKDKKNISSILYTYLLRFLWQWHVTTVLVNISLHCVCILWQRLEHDTGMICCSKSINQLIIS